MTKAIVTKVDSGLTFREEAALRKHRDSGEPPLAPSLAAELYELYLNGMSCEEIARHQPSIRLGSIVRAAEEGDWYNRRLDYMRSLLDGIQGRVQQIHTEGIMFIGLGLSMLNKRLGSKVLNYLQTGDESELGEMKDWGLAQYKQMVDILQKLTGQDQSKKVSVSAQVQHAGRVEHDHQVETNPPAVPMLTPPSPDDAARILEVLSGFGTKLS